MRKKLAHRYAEALKQLVNSEDEIVQINKVYQLFNRIFIQFPEIMKYLKNKGIPLEKRLAFFDKLVDLINIPPYLKHLGRILITKGRVELITEIANIFSKEIDVWLNRVEANVITACTLTREAERALTKSLEEFTGKRIRLVKKIDSKILGGLIVQFYGVTFDFSYRTQIDRIKEEILNKNKGVLPWTSD